MPCKADPETHFVRSGVFFVPGPSAVSFGMRRWPPFRFRDVGRLGSGFARKNRNPRLSGIRLFPQAFDYRGVSVRRRGVCKAGVFPVQGKLDPCASL